MIEIKDITKTYTNGSVETHVLRGVTATILDGEFIAIMGKSGAGKSTFLYQISLLDVPTSGSIHINGINIVELSDRERTQYRLTQLGYVFQEYALIPELTACENVMIPSLMMGMSRSSARALATEALARIGLGHRLDNYPSQLSGGEQQRVSIARAVAQKPTILFADEPTANLDTASAQSVLDVLIELHQAGQTIIMVTHEKEYARDCDRILIMEDGKLVREEKKN